MMFFTSTRFTLMPHLSVASSRMAVILALMTSRLVRVWSSSISPMILRSVVAVRFSMAASGPLHTIGKQLGVRDLEEHHSVYLHGDVVAA